MAAQTVPPEEDNLEILNDSLDAVVLLDAEAGNEIQTQVGEQNDTEVVDNGEEVNVLDEDTPNPLNYILPDGVRFCFFLLFFI